MTKEYTKHRTIAEASSVRQPMPVLLLGRIISFVFHPIFISSYVMGFLIFIHPAVFTGFEHQTKVFRFMTIFLWNLFLPAFTVFLLWRLKLFVNSVQLRTSKERIIPYIIAMTLYWWTWNVFKNLHPPDSPSPPVAVKFLLGSFLAICGAFFCNIYWKISMHTVAMGTALLFFILFSFQDPYTSGSYLAVPLLITGLVCTSRLLVSDHTPFEVYSGLMIGMLAQWIAWIW